MADFKINRQNGPISSRCDQGKKQRKKIKAQVDHTGLIKVRGERYSDTYTKDFFKIKYNLMTKP